MHCRGKIWPKHTVNVMFETVLPVAVAFVLILSACTLSSSHF